MRSAECGMRNMKCSICKNGTTKPGYTHVTMERENTTIVFKAVPAHVCENCGETYIDEDVARKILKLAEDAKQSGIQTEVRQYAEAV